MSRDSSYHPGGSTKIRRPSASGALLRKRLFDLLDKEQKRPLVWVSAPAGSGKTTLISSYIEHRERSCLWYQVDESDADPSTFFHYLGLAAQKVSPRKRKPMPKLTPEYLMGVPAFTRTFFEELCMRMKTPSVLVLDNYQDAGAGAGPLPRAGFHEVICTGLSNLPPGIGVIVLSRTEPPEAFARLQANGRMARLGWDDLRFTNAETGAYLASKHMDRKRSVALMESSQGWIAGIVLLTTSGAGGSERVVPDGAFGYFANEVFRKAKGVEQELMLKTSILKDFTGTDAEKMTGNEKARSILRSLVRNNFFTVETLGPMRMYQYHPLFRAFLLEKLKETLPPQALRDLRDIAATLLSDAGQPEQAAELYAEAEDWQALSGLATAHAQTLLQQGRQTTLAHWLALLPQAVVESNPWLLFWSSTCQFAFAPAESVRLLEKAAEGFSRANDPAGMFLAWAGMTEAVLYGFDDLRKLDDLIDELPLLETRFGAIPPSEIEARVSGSMFRSLCMWRPDSPDFDHWMSRALAATSLSSDINLRCNTVFHASFRQMLRGDVIGAMQYLSELEGLAGRKSANDFAITCFYMCKVMYTNLMRHDAKRCLALVAEGLDHADRSGVHIFDFIFLGYRAWVHTSSHDYSASRSALNAMEAMIGTRPAWDQSLYYFLAAYDALERSELDLGLDHINRSESLMQNLYRTPSLFSIYLTAAHIHHELGNAEKAQEYLDKTRAMIRIYSNSFYECDCRLFEAYRAYARADDSEGARHLAAAFELAKQRGFNTCGLWRQNMMSQLCAKAFEAGIETDFVRQLILDRAILPPKPVLAGEAWPWKVKVRVFGGFALFVDGKPVVFSGKVQKRPLDLLKMLIALGGEDVAKEKLSDALWPDAEGDAAHLALKSLLHRLRHMIGSDEAVRFQEGKITLDPRYFWCDAWAFEQMLDEAGVDFLPRDSLVGSDAAVTQKEARAMVEKALSLYQGHFLDQDREEPWTISPRERLRSRYLRAVRFMAESREAEQDWDGAIGCYLRGLDIDDLEELFYQRLISCYGRIGRQADAARTYQRCESVLRAKLALEPSADTKAIFREVTSGG
ncbi:MAG: hypothetical protein OEW15_13980 [Nitrospirota bacterium]|nr:hypothetical protein [Nitrospirota bacterium]